MRGAGRCAVTPESCDRRISALTDALRRDPALCRAADEREAIRTRLQRRHEDALRALLAAILDATDDAARDEAMARAREVLR